MQGGMTRFAACRALCTAKTNGEAAVIEALETVAKSDYNQEIRENALCALLLSGHKNDDYFHGLLQLRLRKDWLNNTRFDWKHEKLKGNVSIHALARRATRR